MIPLSFFSFSVFSDNMLLLLSLLVFVSLLITKIGYKFGMPLLLLFLIVLNLLLQPMLAECTIAHQLLKLLIMMDMRTERVVINKNAFNGL
jgi:NhaP-type Na+/H+ and K+/H+ antiporter